jgi:hypothetical protein
MSTNSKNELPLSMLYQHVTSFPKLTLLNNGSQYNTIQYNTIYMCLSVHITVLNIWRRIPRYCKHH